MRRLAPPLLVLVVVVPALIYVRGYPWQLALLAGLAASGLVYAAIRTFENMRTLLGGSKRDGGGQP